jgi:hypothetical protein
VQGVSAIAHPPDLVGRQQPDLDHLGLGEGLEYQ